MWSNPNWLRSRVPILVAWTKAKTNPLVKPHDSNYRMISDGQSWIYPQKTSVHPKIIQNHSNLIQKYLNNIIPKKSSKSLVHSMARTARFLLTCLLSSLWDRMIYHDPWRIHVWYIYANIWGIMMVNVTIYSIHGSYGWYMISRGEQNNILRNTGWAEPRSAKPAGAVRWTSSSNLTCPYQVDGLKS